MAHSSDNTRDPNIGLNKIVKINKSPRVYEFVTLTGLVITYYLQVISFPTNPYFNVY